MDAERELIIDELHCSKYIRVIARTHTIRFPKTSESSTEARKEGNELYVKNDHTAQMHEEIFRLYSKSIALAPNESEELALAYGNRSALLLHLQKFEECIKDIDRACKVTKVGSLKEKLYIRKVECLTYLSALEGQEKGEEPLLCAETKDEDMVQNFLKISLREPCAQLRKDKESLISKALAERDGSPSLVAVRYNEKYGRHLVATRDIKPGEIIFVEKPYVACLNIKKPYMHCCHCLSIAWAGIPCDHCGWFMFCSEKCKEEAWKQYHDIECFCIPYITHFLNYVSNVTGQKVCFDGLSIRALIKGIREVGGLEKLKAELQSIDECKDNRTMGFSEDGKFENSQFRSLYSLTSDISSNEMNGHVTFSAIVLVCIAKYTSFFGENFEFCQLEKLTENADVMFIGSLLLRLVKISSVNSHGIVNVNDDCKYNNDLVACRKNWCCVKGVCIVPLASLTNNSCNPNARRCFTEDLKFILYALQPIKKNAQIYDSYYCTFFEAENSIRQNILKENFNFECDCIACKENWPTWPITETNYEELFNSIEMDSKETKVWTRNKKIVESVENEMAHYDKKLLRNVSNAVEDAINSLVQPVAITYKLIFTLIQVFEKLYGYQIQVFHDC